MPFGDMQTAQHMQLVPMNERCVVMSDRRLFDRMCKHDARCVDKVSKSPYLLSMPNHAQTPPIAIAQAIVRQEELRARILDILESDCSSFALDDETDRERCAEVLAAHLVGGR